MSISCCLCFVFGFINRNMEPKRILVIDDDPRNIFALSAVLRSRGFDCIPAANASIGLMVIETEKVDAVLMDMMMPDMDGYEAIPIFKSRLTGIPVIAVTAQAMVGDREKCLAVGADGYVSKPVNIDLLMDLLKDL